MEIIKCFYDICEVFKANSKNFRPFKKSCRSQSASVLFDSGRNIARKTHFKMTTAKNEDVEMKDNEKQEEVSKEKSQEEKDAMAFDGEDSVPVCADESSLPRVNLSAYFQKIFGAEKELIWRLVHSLAQKEALKQWAIQYLMIVFKQYNQLFFGAHWRKKIVVLQNIWSRAAQRFTLARY